MKIKRGNFLAMKKHKNRTPFARTHFSIKISRDAIFDDSEYSSLFDERELRAHG